MPDRRKRQSRSLWVSTPLPYSWSRLRPTRLNSVSVLRRSFGTTLAARAGDRSHRRLPGSHVPPALRRIPSRSDGQRIATRAPSSTSWQGPIWCGRSTISTPDEFPTAASRRRGNQTPDGILRLAAWAFYRGDLALPRAAGQNPRRERDDRQHHHHKDGRGEHLHQFWHGSVPPMTGAVASVRPRASPCPIKAVWLIPRAPGPRIAFFDLFAAISALARRHCVM